LIKIQKCWAYVLFLGLMSWHPCPTNGQEYGQTAEAIPTWPLAPLTKDERFNRIEHLIKPNTYSLIRSTGHMDAQSCNELLDNIKKANRSNILEPVHIVQSIQDPFVQKLLKGCNGKLELDKVYSPPKKFWNGQEPTFYLQPTKNIELYDLSAILGANKWGVLAEAQIPHCRNLGNANDPSTLLCTSLHGYSIFQGASGEIVDTQACSVDFDAQMLGANRLHVNVSTPEEYEEKLSFYAFLSFDNALYRLVYQTGQLVSKAAPVSTLPTEMYVYKISSEEPLDKGICMFKPETH
jgi:hypothetical protein